MKNIELVVRGVKMTMKKEDKLRLSQIMCSHPFAKVTAKKNGKTFRLEFTDMGLCWIEAK